jgi:protein-tyrosine-phosphatase
MAEQLLKRKLKQMGVSGKQVSVSSAGIFARAGATINLNSVLALKSLGINVSPHQKSKQLTKTLVTQNTVVIGMTKEHKDWLTNIKNVYCFGDFDSGIDVPDPFGQPLEVYIKTAKIMEFVINEIAEEIVKNEI